MSALALALMLVVTATPSEEALRTARAHLEAGKPDEVLFALQGVEFEGAAKGEAAELLARAGRGLLEQKDAVFALQFVQMALRHAPTHAGALEVGARASLSQQEYTLAERYADGWLEAAQGAPPARLLRAELAVQQGEWARTLLYIDGVAPSELSRAEKAHFERLRSTANRELQARREARRELDALERELKDRQERAARESSATSRRAASPDADVILYGTSWCGYCKKARAWLTERGVRFTDKDVEKDAGAAEELSRKKAKQQLRHGGVPVIDVRGTLVLGFDQPKLEKLLGSR